MDDDLPIYVIVIGGLTIALILWTVTASSLNRLLGLLAALYPSSPRLTALSRIARRVAPREGDEAGKLEFQAGCLGLIGAVAVVSSGLVFGSRPLWLLPGLAVLWAAGLAAVSMSEALARAREDEAGDSAPDLEPSSPSRRLAYAVQAGCARDLLTLIL